MTTSTHQHKASNYNATAKITDLFAVIIIIFTIVIIVIVLKRKDSVMIIYDTFGFHFLGIVVT